MFVGDWNAVPHARGHGLQTCTLRPRASHYPVVGMEIVAWILQKLVVKWRAPTGTGSLRPRNTDTEGEWRIFNKGAQQARVSAAKKFGARTRAPPVVRTKGSEPSLAKQVVSIFAHWLSISVEETCQNVGSHQGIQATALLGS